MGELDHRDPRSTRWDVAALGEVMLRLDPGDDRIATARTFRVWEGGGEYNVARGAARTFGLRATIVTALADNPVGRLIEDLMRQGGVDLSHVRWVPYDGVGRVVRNGITFTERGFGARAALACPDRGHTAVSQLQPGLVDWDTIFGTEGVRWFHTGGVFAGLSERTVDVAREAMTNARRHGSVVSYDINYRPSLWNGIGGAAAARRANEQLVPLADVLFGNEEDFPVGLGLQVDSSGDDFATIDGARYERMLADAAAKYPQLRVIATTLRVARTASRNDWGAMCRFDGETFHARQRDDLEILDRVGGGDSFASGVIYALLAGLGMATAVEYGAAHGALAMTTPGDTSMATLTDVQRLIASPSTRIVR